MDGTVFVEFSGCSGEIARLESMTGEVVALLGFDDRHQNVICNTSHTHQGEWCLESLFCRDAAERVRRVKTMVVRDGDGG